jgi:hypothetical protein
MIRYDRCSNKRDEGQQLMRTVCACVRVYVLHLTKRHVSLDVEGLKTRMTLLLDKHCVSPTYRSRMRCD